MKKAIFFLICVTLLLSLCSCSPTPAIEAFDINEIFTQYFDSGVPYTFTVAGQEYTLSVAEDNICTLRTTEVDIAEDVYETGNTVTSSIHYQYVGTYELSEDASTLSARFDHLYISADYESDGMAMDQLIPQAKSALQAAYGNSTEYQHFAALLDGKTLEALPSDFGYTTVVCAFSSDESVFSAFRMENYIEGVLDTALELTDKGWLNYRYRYYEDGHSSITVRNENNVEIRSVTTYPDGTTKRICEYEESGAQKEFNYDSEGRPTEEIHYDENNHTVYRASYSYEADGTYRVTQHQNDVLRFYYHYDADGTLLEWYENDENGNVLNGLFERHQDDLCSFYVEYANGLLIQEITYTFDGTPPSYTKYEYDSNGQPVHTTFYDSYGNIWQYIEYNSSGQELMSYCYQPDGTMYKSEYSYNADGTWSEQWYSYDASGNLTGQVRYFYNPDGTLNRRTVTEYSEDGSYTLRTYQNDETISYYHYDADGTLLDWAEYDENRNIINGKISGQWGSDEEWLGIYWEEYSNGLLMRYTRYDYNGILLSTEEYEYDSNGNLLKETHYYSDGDRSYTEYNSNGQPDLHIGYRSDGSWYKIKYSYDNEDRLYCEAHYHYNADGTIEERTEDYYDSNGTTIKYVEYRYNADGTINVHREWYYDSDGTTTKCVKYRYNTDGSINEEKEEYYDSNGNCSGIKDLDYYYNDEGNLTWKNENYYDSDGKRTKSIAYYYNTDGTLDYWEVFYLASDGSTVIKSERHDG